MDSKLSIQIRELTTACILTGGKGSRLDGLDKGLLTVSGKHLVEYCIEKIEPQVSATYLSANRNIKTYQSLGYKVIEDSFGDFEGPLAGFLSGLENTKTPYLVMLPTDAPLFPKDLVTRLLEPIINGKGEASVANVAGRLHPTFCCVPKDGRESLINYLHSGQRKILGWLDTLELIKIDFEIEEEFININDKKDLAVASTYLTNERQI